MLAVKEYAAGKKKLDPALGVKVSVKTGAGRPVARWWADSWSWTLREAAQENRQHGIIPL